VESCGFGYHSVPSAVAPYRASDPPAQRGGPGRGRI
jgi:hypothetical protein